MRAIDELVATGSHKTRAAVIVEAIDRLVADLERKNVDRAIVEGYTRIPQTGEELGWAEESARRSISGEPW